MGSREKVLAAAAEMITEDATASLSVRAVAARAGVSTGSLRFHFATQRDLWDAVLERIYERVIPDDPIRDESLPARERLVNCLRQVLAQTGVDADARAMWASTFERFIAPEPTEKIRTAYAVFERGGRMRIEYWLSTLADEGTLPKGDHTREVDFLITVLNGLSLQRALPAGDSPLRAETRTLYFAVDSVLAQTPPATTSEER